LQDLKEFEKEKLISEYDFYRGKDSIQEQTDEFILRIDEIGRRKEEELLEI
jgi:ribosome recycling factor